MLNIELRITKKSKRLAYTFAALFRHYTNMIRIILIFALSLISTNSYGVEEVQGEYKDVLIKFAYAALHEFYYLNYKDESQSEIKMLEKVQAVVLTGEDKIKRKIYLVLFPREEGSVYVSMILNEDGLLEQHGRGGIPVTLEEFKNNFESNLYLVLSYPGDV